MIKYLNYRVSSFLTYHQQQPVPKWNRLKPLVAHQIYRYFEYVLRLRVYLLQTMMQSYEHLTILFLVQIVLELLFGYPSF